jgi:hypothetical protein
VAIDCIDAIMTERIDDPDDSTKQLIVTSVIMGQWSIYVTNSIEEVTRRFDQTLDDRKAHYESERMEQDGGSLE